MSGSGRSYDIRQRDTGCILRRNSKPRTAAIAVSRIVAALKLVTNSNAVRAQETEWVHHVETGAVSLSFGWLHKTETDSREVAPNRLGAVQDIVEVGETRLIEMIVAKGTMNMLEGNC